MIPAVIFPNSQFPNAANAQANAQTAATILWDFLRTLAHAKEDSDLPSDQPGDWTDIGSGVHVDHSKLAVPTKWCDPLAHPTLAEWAIPIRPLFARLVDVNNADTTIATRAKRIRTALTSGPTITLPSGDTIANGFWTTDAATTLARWNQLAKALGTAVAIDDTWFADKAIP